MHHAIATSDHPAIKALLGVLLVCVGVAPLQASPTESEIRNLAARADALMRLGVSEKGATLAFEDATALIDEAEKQLQDADLPATTESELAREIEAAREDIEDLVELYEERFFGFFPLARLTLPTLLADEGLLITEQLFHPPDVAAVIVATRKAADLLDEYHHPYVVFRSSPPNRHLENVASEELLRDGRSTPQTRRMLINTLGPAGLAAFDRGELTPPIIGRLAQALDAVSLLVLTIGQSVELEDAHVRMIHGQYFQPGNVIQGSEVDASPFLAIDTFSVTGSARDRRVQRRLIWIVKLALLALALAWAAQVKWRFKHPLKAFGRMAIGVVLFLFGRVFAVGVILIMRRFIPDARAMAMASWWWPAAIGLLLILGGGLIAWIGQARLTDIVPGSRGPRAVGTIFALVALGAGSHFVTPLMILDPDTGWASLLAFLLAALILALLFAFAARTGPPVPHYFMLGPLLVAPIVGLALMSASPRLLGLTLALSAVLGLAATVRHKVAVARGTEEPEPDPEQAAEIDKEKLMKIESTLAKKL